MDNCELDKETAEEKARFSEAEAERRLTWLIYRELTKGAAKREVKSTDHW